VVVTELSPDVVNSLDNVSTDFTHLVERRESLELRIVFEVKFFFFFRLHSFGLEK